MPTDSDTGEKHEFDDGGYGARFCQRREGSNAHSGVCCGQPPDAEVHRMPEDHPAWPARVEHLLGVCEHGAPCRPHPEQGKAGSRG